MYDNAGWNPFFGGQQQPMPDGQQQNMMSGSPGMPGIPGMPAWPNWGMNRGQQGSRQASHDFWVPVNTLEEAKNVFVQPGQTKWIMILNTMMFAVKTVNNTGATDFQAFDFHPHVEVQIPPPDQQVSNEALNNLADQLNRVLSELDSVKRDVSSLKDSKEVKNNGRKPLGANPNGNGTANARSAAGTNPENAGSIG